MKASLSFPLQLDDSAPVPLYHQLERKLIDAIAGHRIRPGERLPSHRTLANLLGIAPLTVKRAYDELERSGYLRTERGRGTFARMTPPSIPRDQLHDQLLEDARQLISKAYLAGMSFVDVQQVLVEARDTLDE